MALRLVIKQALTCNISCSKIHCFVLLCHLAVELLQPLELVAGLLNFKKYLINVFVF